MLQAGPEFAAWRAAHPASPLADTRPTVHSERDVDTLVVTLDRTDRHNAISLRMRDELAQALSVAVVDESITDVVLRGNGPSFCSGGDLDEFGTRPDPATAHVTRLARSPARLIHELAARTTVQLHGAAFGGGIEMAAFARSVHADPDTRDRAARGRPRPDPRRRRHRERDAPDRAPADRGAGVVRDARSTPPPHWHGASSTRSRPADVLHSVEQWAHGDGIRGYVPRFGGRRPGPARSAPAARARPRDLGRDAACGRRRRSPTTRASRRRRHRCGSRSSTATPTIRCGSAPRAATPGRGPQLPRQVPRPGDRPRRPDAGAPAAGDACPSVDESAAWATAGSEVADLDVPEIDTEVWIEYEYGDPAYPRWVGLI